MHKTTQHLIRILARFARASAFGFAIALGATLIANTNAALIRPAHAESKPLSVVTTTEDLAAIAREVGGDRVRVTSLCKGYQDPHFVDAKPSFMVQLKNAALFVEVGRDLEVGWAPGLLNGARNPRILPGAPGFVDASSQVQVIEVPASVSRAQGDVHPFGNPHYWLDPANGAPIARSIRDGLVRVSPGDAALFNQRCADFEQRLGVAVTRWKQQAKTIGLTGKKVVTYHRSWSYFARAFELTVVDFVEPRPGIPPSPNHVQDLVTRMKQGDIALLVMEDFFDPRLPQKIATQTAVPLVILPTSVGADDKIRTYFDLFDHLFASIGGAMKSGAKS
ncbi:MAG TPA: metal ABC transporter substrate-binding protein [Candidatus Eisenbacteria bacterium]|nr:metal ABC transporter substrate-binding protein [Candidatus Eisenbacteria bacterium]